MRSTAAKEDQKHKKVKSQAKAAKAARVEADKARAAVVMGPESE
jgi:hypothetical protein